MAINFGKPTKPNQYFHSSFKKDRNNPEWISKPLSKPIEIEGYEDVDISIIKETKADGTYWRISENYTGFRLYVSIFPETKADAIENLKADMRIKKISKAKMLKLIQANIDKWGYSPRYT